MINWFNKPKWQNKNEEVRALAISTGDESELQPHLPAIIAEDPSERVKKAALNRLKDPEQIIQVLKTGVAKSLQPVLLKRVCDWLINGEDGAAQLQAAQLIQDVASREKLAALAHNSSVRAHFIRQINKPALLGELSLSESDADLALEIMQRVNDPETLQKMHKLHSKRKTPLATAIEERLNAMQQDDVQPKALALCQQLENCIHQKPGAQNIDLADIQAQWQRIEARVPEDLKRRFNGTFNTVKVALEPASREEFLRKQKQQRIQHALEQAQDFLAQAEKQKLQLVQEHVNTVRELDLDLATDEQLNRRDELLEQLRQVRNEKIAEQQIPASVTQVMDRLQTTLGKDTVPADSIGQFKRQWKKQTERLDAGIDIKSLQQQFDQMMLKLAEKIEHGAQRRDRDAETLIELIEETEQRIADGKLAEAKALTNRMAKLKHSAGFSHPLVRKNKFKLDQVWKKINELRKWQKWSNDKIRTDIIDELQALVGTGMHPDAVLKKLQESNQRWSELEEMEKLEGDKYPVRNHKLWHRFRAVSKALFDPAQPYYAKRSEQWQAHQDEVDVLLKSMAELDLENSDERTLSNKSREAIRMLKKLNELPPKKRGATAKKLRKGIDRIEQRLDTHYEVAERRKLKLIEQAEALAELENTAEAIQAAIGLQAEWKDAGFVRQKAERKLWKKFRKANDRVFQRREDDNRAVRAERNAHNDAAEGLIKQFLKSIDQTADAQALKSLMEKTQDQWHGMQIEAKGLRLKMNKARDTAQDKLNRLANQAVLTGMDALAELSDICEQLELGRIDSAAAEKRWAAVDQDAVDKGLMKRMQQRHAAATQTGEDGDNAERLQSILIAAEYATGLPTPKAFEPQRMAHQVEQLSNRMAGEDSASPQQQAHDLLIDWYTSSHRDADFIKAHAKRIDKSLKALLKLLTG